MRHFSQEKKGDSEMTSPSVPQPSVPIVGSGAPSSDFAKPVLPKANNVHGLPQPPSGLHPSTSPQAVFTPTGHDWTPDVPSAVGTKDTGLPNVSHGLRDRLAAIFRRAER
jgi:hypothetical protein